MKSTSTLAVMVAAAAVTGLLVGATARGDSSLAGAKATAAAADKSGCGGKDGCGGKNGCKATTEPTTQPTTQPKK